MANLNLKAGQRELLAGCGRSILLALRLIEQ